MLTILIHTKLTFQSYTILLIWTLNIMKNDHTIVTTNNNHDQTL